MKTLCFDLETRENPAVVGWRNYEKQGISFACAYLDWVDEYHLYTEDDLVLLIASMCDADVITGFNILNFDFPLLQATCARNGVRILEGWDSFIAKSYDPMTDICEALGVKIPKGWNLDNIAKSNLTVCKNGDGAKAPGLYQSGQWGRLGSYVIQDVKTETHLFRHCRDKRALQNNFIKMGEAVSVPLPRMDALCEKFGIAKPA